MRKAKIFIHGRAAGILEEIDKKNYRFEYLDSYSGPPVSLTMPMDHKIYEFEKFPAFFEGLLPEGVMLNALLKKTKLDKNDYFGQLITVGKDLVGAVTIEEVK